MFGAFRFLLAFMVVASHLIGTEQVNHLGPYAVRGFFALSGYVLTAALNEHYQFDFARFWTNRLLKILPGYFLLCLLTLATISAWPLQTGHFFSRWSEQPTVGDLIQNAILLPLAFGNLQFRLFEPGWSLAVELAMGILLWLGLARNLRSAVIVLAVGAFYHVAMLAIDEPFAARFYAIPAALLSFSLGAALYFVKSEKRVWTNGQPGALVAFGIAAWATNLVLASIDRSDFEVHTIGYYLDILTCTLIVAGLADLKVGPFFARLDRSLGELAYSVFLCQWLGGFLAHEFILPSQLRGVPLFIAAVPIILLMALAIHRLQVFFVDPWRVKIRGPVDARWKHAHSIEPLPTPAQAA